jgi:uncharacterized membrane protein
MIPQIIESIKSLSPGGKDEELTILEKIEQENKDNVTDRHLLKAEKEFENEISNYSLLQSFSVSVSVNSIISLGLLYAIQNLVISSSFFQFWLVTSGVNFAACVISSENDKSAFYNIALGVSKFSINLAVNGGLLSTAHQKQQESVKTIESIEQEIRRYERGYQPEEFDFNMIYIFLGLAFVVFLMGKFSGKNK